MIGVSATSRAIVTTSRTMAITLVTGPVDRPQRLGLGHGDGGQRRIDREQGERRRRAPEAGAEEAEDRVGGAADRRRQQQHADHFVADRVDQGTVEAVAVALVCRPTRVG